LTARSLLRRAAVATAALSAITVGATSVPVSASVAPAAVVREVYTLGPGVTLKVLRYPDIPQEVRVLEVAPAQGATLDALPAGNAFPSRRAPSGVGAANGVAAAVNGDFANVADSRPLHAWMIDGELWTSGLRRGAGFGSSPDGSQAYAGDVRITIAGGSDAGAFSVADWNVDAPTADAIDAYTSRGGKVVAPPGTATPDASSPSYCAARLAPTSPIGWSGAGRRSLARSYTVEEQPDACPQTPLAVGSTAGAVVLAARAGTAGAATVRGLDPGARVRLTWGVADWPGVTDLTGGSPSLLVDGLNVGPPYTPGAGNLYQRNPRTAVGVTQGCTDDAPKTRCRVIVVTVDGRQVDSLWSAGMEFPPLADLLARQGAWDAVAFDGGGGTVMWTSMVNDLYCQSYPLVGGCRVNRPAVTTGSDERPTVGALGVRLGPDPGESGLG
jgi:hypothetical protein